MPGARIALPEVEIALSDSDKLVLVFELLSMKRDDAADVADLLQTTTAQPLEPSDAHAFALLRALDNLRWAGDLNGRHELLRLRDCLVSNYGVTVSYELQLTDDEIVPWTSYSGPFEVGDRLPTINGSSWRVTRKTSRHAPEDDLLVCKLDLQ